MADLRNTEDEEARAIRLAWNRGYQSGVRDHPVSTPQDLQTAVNKYNKTNPDFQMKLCWKDPERLTAPTTKKEDYK